MAAKIWEEDQVAWIAFFHLSSGGEGKQTTSFLCCYKSMPLYLASRMIIPKSSDFYIKRTKHNISPQVWPAMFMLGSAIAVFTNTIFVLLGTSRLQVFSYNFIYHNSCIICKTPQVLVYLNYIEPFPNMCLHFIQL